MTLSTHEKPLPEPVVAAVLIALDDEYHAEATYAAIMGVFGEVRPFCNIIEAERRHAAALIDILNKHDQIVPPNPYLAGEKPLDPVPETLAAACTQGVEAEIANVRLYDEDLLPTVDAYPEITGVFRALRDASENNHLPAFRRCASRSRGNGAGRNGRNGRGQASQKET